MFAIEPKNIEKKEKFNIYIKPKKKRFQLSFYNFLCCLFNVFVVRGTLHRCSLSHLRTMIKNKNVPYEIKTKTLRKIPMIGQTLKKKNKNQNKNKNLYEKRISRY